MSTYSDLLKDPRWQKVRLKKLEAAGWACQSCYDSEEMLAVHHKRYVKGRKPWEYMDHELVVLCQPCHSEEHEAKCLHSDLVSIMDVDGPSSEGDLFAIMAGYLAESKCVDYAAPIYQKFSERSPYFFELGRLTAGLSARARKARVLAEIFDQLGREGSDTDLLIDHIVESIGSNP